MKAEDLRKSILQLAIQGKLVPQDPNDEPASVLLERIRIEKQKLIKEGKIKKDKGESIIFKGDDNRHYEKTISEVKNITDEIPFDIPDSWCWVRLYDIVFIETGKKDANFGDASGKYNFYTCAMEPIKAKSYSYDGDYLILPGNGANVGMSIHYIGKFEAYQRTYLLSKKTNDISFPYLQIILNAYWKDYNKDKQYGSAIPYIKLGNLENFLVPMTSYKEQERIVAEIEKFEPLIAEYDKLEQQATKLDNEIYDNLKKSILQYAIQGKLVPQDPNDEPASVLLARIRAEKKAQLGKKYVESYIYKGDDNCYYEHINGKNVDITEEIPFDLPSSWEWCRLKNLIVSLTDGTHSTPKYTASGVHFISVKDVSSGKLSFDNTKYISLDEHNELKKRCNPQKGDILLTKVGTTGIPVLIDSDIEFSLFVSVALIKFSHENIIPDYLIYLLKSPLVQEQAAENTRGVGNKNWVLSDIEKTLLVLPPLAEQKRIVKKIDEIFAQL
jgi:type I restriction enzyme S subunit